SIVDTKVVGQIKMARPPATTAQRPRVTMARMWSAPLSGWAIPKAKELVCPTPVCARAGETIAPVKATQQIKINRISDSSADWIVNGNELGAVDERCLHFHLVDHFRDALHHLIAAENLAAFGHELGDGLAVARAFHHKICDQGDAFGIIEFDASCEPSSRDERRQRDHELVFFARCQVHDLFRSMAGFNRTTSSA